MPKQVFSFNKEAYEKIYGNNKDPLFEVLDSLFLVVDGIRDMVSDFNDNSTIEEARAIIKGIKFGCDNLLPDSMKGI